MSSSVRAQRSGSASLRSFFREFAAPAVDGRAERTLARSHVAPECDGRDGRVYRRNHPDVRPFKRPVGRLRVPASARVSTERDSSLTPASRFAHTPGGRARTVADVDVGCAGIECRGEAGRRDVSPLTCLLRVTEGGDDLQRAGRPRYRHSVRDSGDARRRRLADREVISPRPRRESCHDSRRPPSS